MLRLDPNWTQGVGPIGAAVRFERLDRWSTDPVTLGEIRLQQISSYRANYGRGVCVSFSRSSRSTAACAGCGDGRHFGGCQTETRARRRL